MLSFNDVTFAYPDGHTALRTVSFEGAGGDFLLVLGHNGAGKSTLLKLLNGILKPTSGQVLVDGLDTREHSTATLAQHAAVTFQNPGDQIFASSVEKEIQFGPSSLRRAGQSKLVDDALETFGFSHNRASHPYDLPPSRRKLLTVACAAAMGSPVLAFDEPSAGLSIPERAVLRRGLTALTAQNRLTLVVSHDLDLFLPIASRVIVVRQGEIVFDDSPDTILYNEGVLRRTGLKLPLVMRMRKAFDLRPFE